MSSTTPWSTSTVASDPVVVMSEPSPSPSKPSDPVGRVYRSTGRPGLTPAGVAVIGTAISLVAAIVSMLLNDSIGWIFGVPFVLVSAYCAWEVRPDSLRSALVMPPLVLLLVAVVIPVVFGEVSDVRDGVLRMLTVLTKLAPMLFIAVGASGVIVAWRRWGRGRS